MSNKKATKKLVIAVSSQSLFNFNDGDAIFRSEGQEAFDKYMVSKQNIPLKPGPAFPLVKKLLNLNAFCGETPLVDVVLLSRNSPSAGVRVLNSVGHYGLQIEKSSFCSGGDRFKYAKAFKADLFLSTNAADVKAALDNGIAAASLMAYDTSDIVEDPVVRIAFDGDSVLFSDEADKVYHEHGLDAFRNNEVDNASTPLGDGPFKPFLMALTSIQEALKPNHKHLLRLSLVTARGMPAHSRVINTLNHWGVHLDEFNFCGGAEKGPVLTAFGADIFFDDSQGNIDSAHNHGIAAGKVPYGTGGIVVDNNA